MHRRTFCRLLGLAPVVVAVGWNRRAAAQLPTPAVPQASALRTIEVEPGNDQAEPPVLSCAALSPDGRTVAAAGDDHYVRLWTVADGKLVAQWHEHTDWIRSIAYSPSGKQLLTAGDDHRVLQWEVATGKVLFDVTNLGGVVHKAAYLPDGKQIAFTGFDGKIRLANSADGVASNELIGSGDDLRGLTISPNGERLAAAGRDGVIRVWSLVDRKQTAEIPAHRMRIRVLSFSTDGERLLSAGDDRKFYLWNVDGTREATLPSPPGRLMAGTFLGRDRIAVGGSDNIIRILDLTTKRELRQLVGHSGSIAALDFYPDTSMLVSSSFDTSLRLWRTGDDDARRPQMTQRLPAIPAR